MNVTQPALRRSVTRLFRGLRYFVHGRRDALVIGLLAALTFVGTMLEAGALGLIAPTALAIVGGDDRVTEEISFLSLDVSVDSLIGVIAVLLIASGVFQVAQSWVRAALMSRVEVERRRVVILAFLGATWERASQSTEGALQEVMNYVRHSVVGLGELAALAKAATSFLVMVVLAVLVDVRAAVGIVVVVSLLSLFLLPFARKLRHENRQLAGISMEQAELIGEIRRTVREITVFGSREHYTTELDDVLERWRRHRRRAALLNNVSKPLYQYVGLFAVVSGLYLLSLLGDGSVISASVSALLLIRSISYGQDVQTRVQQLFAELPYAQLAEVNRKKLVDAAWETGDTSIDDPQQIELSSVTYTYPGGDGPALDDVTVRLGLHESIGLVGASGSGKSTLAQVLLRLRIPQRGEVRLDGHSAEDVPPGDWFRHVSYVPQAAVLIRGTLRENVTMHRPWVSDDDVRRALSDAGLDDLPDQLGRGLESKLGQRGRDLSGGQLQRLGIARALAGGPTWVILDEPTSALDLSTEAIVQETLARLKGRVGLVIIAHRLSTLSTCERLIVMDEGRVDFDGPADQAFRESPFLVEARRLGALPGAERP